MNTYICKCGRTFQKNTEAGTTGFRMPDYGPDHECYGCPFVCKVMTWDPVKQMQAVQNHECRGSKSIRYDTTGRITSTDKTVADIFTLDFEFLQQIHKFAVSLEGFSSENEYNGDPYKSASCYGTDGRFRYPIYPLQNLKGVAAKVTLKEHFFNPDGSRKDVTPEQEKEVVLKQIKEAKALAQGKTATTGMAFVHGNFRYFVDQREDNGKFTAFISSPSLGEGVKSEVPTIRDFDTFEEAQNALDGFALKKEYATEGSAPEENPEMELQTLGSDSDGSGDSVPHEDDAPEVEHDSDRNDPPTDESPDFQDDTGNSANEAPEGPQMPCDWKNASGGDDDDEDEESEKTDQSLPDGPDLSLRLPAFDAIFNAADDALRDMARTLKTKFIESGELNLKIVIDNMGGILRPNCKSSKGSCQLKPAKVTFPIRFSDDIEFTVDAQGRVILPEDREHQINFDEIQPGQREIPPSGTATVDGNTGIVEDYQEDGDGDQAPEDDQGGEPEGKLYPCTNTECPFYEFQDEDNTGCGFTSVDDADDGFDITEAVEENVCTRPEVMEAYSAICPTEGTDFADNCHDQGDDFPEFEDEEMGQDAS